MSRATDGYSYPNNTEFGTFDNNNFIAATIRLSGNCRSKFFLIDSTIHSCPWHLPFQLIAHADGVEDSLGQSFPSSKDFLWTVSNAFVSNDVLQLSDGSYGHEDIGSQTLTSSSSVEINFVHGKDSISSISISSSYSLAGPDTSSGFTFQISSLAFDSSGIFTSDSSFCAHKVVISSGEQGFGGTNPTSFTATSATLSGIFRPTHYPCAESVLEPKEQAEGLTVTSSNHALNCSFSASDVPRRLDVFSILGAPLASDPIQHGEVNANVSGLSPGFYFVRLGNAVAKAIVTE